MSPGNLCFDRGVRDRLLSAVVEGDDRLLAADDSRVSLGRVLRQYGERGTVAGTIQGGGITAHLTIQDPTGRRFNI